MAELERDARQINNWADPAYQANLFEDTSMREDLAFGMREQDHDRIREKARVFSESFIKYLDDVRSASMDNRDDEFKNSALNVSSYKDVYDLEVARAENKVRASYGDETGKDGHATIGVMMGWTSQAVKYMRAKLYSRYFDAYERPYRPSMIGDKAEAKELEAVVVAVLDDMMRRCDYGQSLINLFNNVATHGTAYLRVEFARKLVCKRDKEGAAYYEEIDSTVEPVMTVYNNMDVLVSDWEVSESEDQELVFYCTPETSLPYLEKQEAVFDLSVSNGVFEPTATVVKTGKFTNLYGLRRATFDKISQDFDRDSRNRDDQVDGKNTSEERNIKKSSTFPTIGLVECEGRINMAPFVYSGELDQETAEFYGIQFDRKYNLEDDADLYEFAQVLNARHWHVAYTLGAPLTHTPKTEGSETAAGGKYLIRMDDGIIDLSRNGLFKIVLHRGSKNQFMGLSINRLIRPMEDAADFLMNKIGWAQAQNANPNYLYYEDALVDGKNKEIISKLWTGMGQGFALSRRGGPGESVDASKVAVPLLHQVDIERAYSYVDRLKGEVEMTSAVTMASKTGADATGSGTATGAQISQAKVDMQDGLIVGGIIRELNYKMMPFIIEGVSKGMGAGFVNYAMRVAGRDATDQLAQKLVSKDGWWNEFRFDHPTVKGIDPAVISQGLAQLVTTYPGEFDTTECARVSAEALVVRPSALMAKKPESQTPDLKVKLLTEGNYVSVLPGDDDLQCMLALQKFAQEIMSGIAVVPDPEATAARCEQLIMEHQQAAMMKQQMMMQQQAMAEAMGGGGGMQGANAGSVPASSAEMSGQIQGQANQVPGGAVASGAF